MDFNPKTSKLRNQEEVDKHLASYDFHLNLGKNPRFAPMVLTSLWFRLIRMVIYASPGLALELRLPMTRFVCSVLIFTGSPPLSCQWWPSVQF